MEMLIKVAGNLERHARALDELADELERLAPPADTQAGTAWIEEDLEGRVERLRHEAKLARRAISRVEETLAEHSDAQGPGADSGSERAAA